MLQRPGEGRPRQRRIRAGQQAVKLRALLEGAQVPCYATDILMRVHLHPQGRTVELAGRRSVARLLEELQILPGTVMVIREGFLLLEREMLEDGDELELRAVISGGAA